MKAWLGATVFLAAALLPITHAYAVAEPAQAASPTARAGPQKSSCDIDALKREATNTRGIAGTISSVVSTSADRCVMLKTILKMIIAGDIVAGRQAKPPTPLDLQAAQRELDAARATPDIRSAIDGELADVQDRSERILLEAVVLHDEGKRLARDLLLRQLAAAGQP